MPLGAALRAARERHPAKPALLFDPHCWSYAQFDEITDRIGASLRRLGVRPGDRVALQFTNCPELVFGYYACFKIGAAAVPLNTRLKGPELEYILNHCGARVLLGQPDLFPEVQAVRPNLSSVEQCYVTGDYTVFSGVRPFAALTAAGDDTLPFPAFPDHTLAVILYTSGTTARPKGVMHTHATLRHAAAEIVAFGHRAPEDILGVVTPLCHTSGLTCHLLPVVEVGSTALVIPPSSPEQVLKALAEHRVTTILAMPVLFNNLVHCAAAAAYDVSALRVCFSGGDAVTPELQQRFHETFGVELIEGWAMTEVCPGCANPLAGAKKVGSIGRPVGDLQVRLVDDAGRDVPPGETGEMWVRSAAMTVGYWREPEATAAALADGWLRTGDLARQDADGDYWFVGRKKEIIIRGGSNISPLEVEAVLCEHPAVKEAGVIGVPHPEWGEIVRAYVSLKDGASTTEADLKQFAQARLAAYKLPETITMLPELPKGPTGKVHRKTLRDAAVRRA